MKNQNELALNTQQKIESVADFKFELQPIKGYPELRWRGKRPFTGTQFYPAQLKERHGEEVDGWINKIFWGDNLQVMSHLIQKFRGQVNLIYIDPPFDSRADYKKSIQVKSKQADSSKSVFEEKQYSDIWSNDEYLQFLYERLLIMRELLSETGSIYVHCDWHKSHNIRCMLDEVFGSNNFRNEIIWQRTRSAKFQSNTFSVVHDTIYLYSKTENYKFNSLYTAHRDELIESHYNKIDPETGRKYTLDNFTQKGQGDARLFGTVKLDPPLGKHWIWSQERIDKGMRDGRIVFSASGMPRLKRYLDETKGEPIPDMWIDITELNSQASERLAYPTQKPERLLERIISASSDPGDLVFDCFMGSGTTQAASLKLGRKFIGADINLGAIQTTTKRLIQISYNLKGGQDPKVKQLKIKEQLEEDDALIAAEDRPEYGNSTGSSYLYTGFEVYNVNHYDVFRNPIEAKELLIKALEVQPLPNNNLYDGEKDGRMVKIMPVNRIATRADLNELITGFNYKDFEKRNSENPGKPVESITLVCMGHEPDLAAQLKSNVPFGLDVEVVDILRDKSNLEFKRDAEAEITISTGKLEVKQFYPMNLLQKLSLMKDNVTDWRELVESVMIDFNYDGAVFEPSVVDVPEKNELVRGNYEVPKNAGTIRVKITDLLSESLEQTING